MLKPMSVDRCALFVLNRSHLSYAAEEGGARLSQLQRIFHIACINGVIFKATMRKEFTIQSGTFIAGEEPWRQSRS